MGFPTERRETTGLRAGGASQSFDRGAIVWSAMTGAQVSKGAIRTAWLKNGAQDGRGPPRHAAHHQLRGAFAGAAGNRDDSQ
ncbi:hypothetical protein R5O87_14415 [Arthrobacter globiformis]|uniref:hypothetical protein n=1 Tax=Arthrobacter globiformis TaxID=1665 RepID=UPI00397C3681